MSTRIVTVALMLLACGSIRDEATAWLQVCNRSPKDILIAVVQQDPRCLITMHGYKRILPCGGCRTVVDGDLQREAPYYVYAVATDGTEWAGDFYFCTPDRPPFDTCRPRAGRNCSQGYKSLGYREYTPKAKDFTVNLNALDTKQRCYD